MRENFEPFFGRSFTSFSAAFLTQLDRNFERLFKRQKLAVTVVTTAYAVKETDDVVVYTGTGGHTITLPNATAYKGYQFAVKHAGAGVLTLDATSAGQLWTSLGLVNSVTLAVGDGVDLVAGNTNWQIV